MPLTLVVTICSEIQNDSSQEEEPKASANGNAAAESTDSKLAELSQPKIASAKECAAEMVQTILQLKVADSGKFLHNDGTPLPY